MIKYCDYTGIPDSLVITQSLGLQIFKPVVIQILLLLTRREISCAEENGLYKFLTACSN